MRISSDGKNIGIYPDSKGIRLDLYVKDDRRTSYSIEMQAQNVENIPKRSRYYQSVMDVDALQKGEYYSQLRPGFVIFVCTLDPFGEGRHIYTFQNTCQENRSLLLGDDTHKIFLNVKGKMQDVNEKVKAFLKCVDNDFTSDDDLVRKLERAVADAKNNQKWRAEYMILTMRERDKLEEGKNEGRSEGELLKLINLVRKKKELSQSVERIAEDLLEDPEVISRIIDVIDQDKSATDEELLTKCL